jgi:hypothetical protein
MLFYVISFSTGLFLLHSAWVKFSNLKDFAEILDGYPFRIKPIFIVIFEAALGVLLISFYSGFIVFGLIGASIFIGLATSVILLRAIRGEKKLRCGCGRDLSETHDARWLIARNLLILSSLIWAWSGFKPQTFVAAEVFLLYLVSSAVVMSLYFVGAFWRAGRAVWEWKVFG